MGKLINADEFAKQFTREIYSRIQILEMLKDAPEEYVQKVTYCEDCKFYDPEDCWCRHLKTYMGETDFCSSGDEPSSADLYDDECEKYDAALRRAEVNDAAEMDGCDE